jgi:hypothetical protein
MLAIPKVWQWDTGSYHLWESPGVILRTGAKFLEALEPGHPILTLLGLYGLIVVSSVVEKTTSTISPARRIPLRSIWKIWVLSQKAARYLVECETHLL